MAVTVIYSGPNGAVSIDTTQNVTVSADYYVQPSDYIITAVGAGSFTIFLLKASLYPNKNIIIKCLTTASITVSAYSGDLIDSSSTKTMSNGEVLDIISNNDTKWIDTDSSTISGAKIVNGTITNSKLATDSVTADKIAAGAVGASELATDSVTADKIAAGAVGSSELATDSVTADKIATGAVGSSELATDSVTADKIATGAVGSSELATDSVTADKIAAGAVGASEINTSAQPTVNTIYTNNWFRSNGATGWYNETYAGGIWMEDSNYVKVYNNKAFMPSSGDGINGIIFPQNPGGGGGDSASIQYYAYQGEETVLALKVANDTNERILLSAPNASFVVGQSFVGNNAIQGYTDSQIEFKWAPSLTSRYLRMQNDGNMVIYDFFNNALWSAGTAASDIKLKENIKTYTDSGINIIKKLNVVSFNYLKNFDSLQLNRIGFIAQEVEKLIPQAIKSVGPSANEQTLLLYKEEIVPHIVKALQEQQDIIELQTKRIESLEERIQKLEELINKGT